MYTYVSIGFVSLKTIHTLRCIAYKILTIKCTKQYRQFIFMQTLKNSSSL